MVFIAKYPGRCDDCREPISPGQEVEYKVPRDLKPRLVHVICDSAGALTEDAALDVCPECLLLKPCVCGVF